MGVRGLLSHCVRNISTLGIEVDLVAEAEHRGGLKLLVDFTNFLFKLETYVIHFLQIRNSDVSLTYLYLYGGEYDVIDILVQRYVKILRQQNIELVFFLDASLGTDIEGFNAKFETNKARSKENYDSIVDISHVCNGYKGSEVGMVRVSLSLLAKTQVIRTLQSLKVELCFSEMEAESTIMQYMKANEEAFAILGADSDFCLMDGSNFIIMGNDNDKETFDVTGEFTKSLLCGMKSPKLEELICYMITPEKLVESFELRDRHELIEVAILTGSDFTKPFIEKYEQQKFFNQNVEGYKKFANGGTVESIPIIASLLTKDKEFKEAIEYSRRFYNNELIEPASTQIKPPSLLYLEDNVQRGNFDTVVLSWYNKVYWKFIRVEDMSPKKVSSYHITENIRKYLYAIVTERRKVGSELCVKEYGRTDSELFAIKKVFYGDLQGKVPSAVDIATMSVSERQHLFDTVMSQSENTLADGINHNYFTKYGPKTAFKCYIVHYLIIASKNPQSHLTFDVTELIAIVMMMFCPKQNFIAYEGIPSIRCLSLSTLLQVTYNFSEILASLLLLPDIKPNPRDIFIGRAFVDFYMTFVETGVSQDMLPQPVQDIYLDLINSNTLLTESDRKVLQIPSKTLEGSFEVKTPRHTPQLSTSEWEESDDIPDPQFIEPQNPDELPIMRFRDEIISHLKTHRVVCIEGETGCGKSTKVPQFILDDYKQNPLEYVCKPNIIVAQPRRIAACTLAERVASERGCAIGTEVGYKIGQDYTANETTSLLFVTTGYLIQRLVHNPNSFKNLTHIILDEVHERELDSDLLSLIVKLLALNHKRVKVVIMSATIQGDLFIRYFTTDEELANMTKKSVFVGAKRFPVEEIYLEDIYEQFKSELNPSQLCSLAENISQFNRTSLAKYYNGEAVAKNEDMECPWTSGCDTPGLQGCGAPGLQDVMPLDFRGVMPLDYKGVIPLDFNGAMPLNFKSVILFCFRERNAKIKTLVTDLVNRKIMTSQALSKQASKANGNVLIAAMKQLTISLIKASVTPGESILMFLPGYMDIDMFYEMLAPYEQNSRWKCPICIFALHSMIPFEDQLAAFKPPSPNVCHIFLATNVAESSLTLPKVRLVIDFGWKKQNVYKPDRKMTVLEVVRCSKASLSQRKGRTGRVFPGKCIRMFTKAFCDTLPLFDMPQMQIAPLDKLVLEIKFIGNKILPGASPTEILLKSVEPPPVHSIKSAVQMLHDVGALEENDENSHVTLLGNVCMRIPVDIVLCRLILYGVLFGCPCDTIIMAAALQCKDPFNMPTKKVQKIDSKFVESLNRSTHARSHWDDGNYSIPIMFRNLYVQWLRFVKYKMVSVADLASEARGRVRWSVLDVKKKFCHENAVSQSRLNVFENLVKDLTKNVKTMLSPHSDMRRKLILFQQSQAHGKKWNKHGRILEPEDTDKRWHHVDENPLTFDMLFCEDICILNAALAAALNPAYVMGSVKGLSSKDEKKRKHLKEKVNKSGCDSKTTVVMKDVPDWFIESPSEVIKTVICGITRATNVAVAEGNCIVVEHGKSIPQNKEPTTYVIPSKRTQQKKKVIQNDIPSEAHMLFKFSEDKNTFSIQISEHTKKRFNIPEDVVILSKPESPYQLKWNLLSAGGKGLRTRDSGFKAVPSWKDPIGFACDTEEKNYLGVVYNYVACGSKRAWVDGLSVFPNDSNNLIAIVFILAFQPDFHGMKFNIDSLNRRITSVTTFRYEFKFTEEFPLTMKLLSLINDLRAEVNKVYRVDWSISDEIIPGNKACIILHKLLREAKKPSASQAATSSQPKGAECSQGNNNTLDDEDSSTNEANNVKTKSGKKKKGTTIVIDGFRDSSENNELEIDESNAMDDSQNDNPRGFNFLHPYRMDLLDDATVERELKLQSGKVTKEKLDALAELADDDDESDTSTSDTDADERVFRMDVEDFKQRVDMFIQNNGTAAMSVIQKDKGLSHGMQQLQVEWQFSWRDYMKLFQHEYNITKSHEGIMLQVKAKQKLISIEDEMQLMIQHILVNKGTNSFLEVILKEERMAVLVETAEILNGDKIDWSVFLTCYEDDLDCELEEGHPELSVLHPPLSVDAECQNLPWQFNFAVIELRKDICTSIQKATKVKVDEIMENSQLNNILTEIEITMEQFIEENQHIWTVEKSFNLEDWILTLGPDPDRVLVGTTNDANINDDVIVERYYDETEPPDENLIKACIKCLKSNKEEYMSFGDIFKDMRGNTLADIDKTSAKKLLREVLDKHPEIFCPVKLFKSLKIGDLYGLVHKFRNGSELDDEDVNQCRQMPEEVLKIEMEMCEKIRLLAVALKDDYMLLSGLSPKEKVDATKNLKKLVKKRLQYSSVATDFTWNNFLIRNSEALSVCKTLNGKMFIKCHTGKCETPKIDAEVEQRIVDACEAFLRSSDKDFKTINEFDSEAGVIYAMQDFNLSGQTSKQVLEAVLKRHPDIFSPIYIPGVSSSEKVYGLKSIFDKSIKTPLSEPTTETSDVNLYRLIEMDICIEIQKLSKGNYLLLTEPFEIIGREKLTKLVEERMSVCDEFGFTWHSFFSRHRDAFCQVATQRYAYVKSVEKAEKSPMCNCLVESTRYIVCDNDETDQAMDQRFNSTFHKSQDPGQPVKPSSCVDMKSDDEEVIKVEHDEVEESTQSDGSQDTKAHKRRRQRGGQKKKNNQNVSSHEDLSLVIAEGSGSQEPNVGNTFSQESKTKLAEAISEDVKPQIDMINESSSQLDQSEEFLQIEQKMCDCICKILESCPEQRMPLGSVFKSQDIQSLKLRFATVKKLKPKSFIQKFPSLFEIIQIDSDTTIVLKSEHKIEFNRKGNNSEHSLEDSPDAIPIETTDVVKANTTIDVKGETDESEGFSDQAQDLTRSAKRRMKQRERRNNLKGVSHEDLSLAEQKIVTKDKEHGSDQCVEDPLSLSPIKAKSISNLTTEKETSKHKMQNDENKALQIEQQLCNLIHGALKQCPNNRMALTHIFDDPSINELKKRRQEYPEPFKAKSFIQKYSSMFVLKTVGLTDCVGLRSETSADTTVKVSLKEQQNKLDIKLRGKYKENSKPEVETIHPDKETKVESKHTGDIVKAKSRADENNMVSKALQLEQQMCNDIIGALKLAPEQELMMTTVFQIPGIDLLKKKRKSCPEPFKPKSFIESYPNVFMLTSDEYGHDYISLISETSDIIPTTKTHIKPVGKSLKSGSVVPEGKSKAVQIEKQMCDEICKALQETSNHSMRMSQLFTIESIAVLKKKRVTCEEAFQPKLFLEQYPNLFEIKSLKSGCGWEFVYLKSNVYHQDSKASSKLEKHTKSLKVRETSTLVSNDSRNVPQASIKLEKQLCTQITKAIESSPFGYITMSKLCQVSTVAPVIKERKKYSLPEPFKLRTFLNKHSKLFRMVPSQCKDEDCVTLVYPDLQQPKAKDKTSLKENKQSVEHGQKVVKTVEKAQPSVKSTSVKSTKSSDKIHHNSYAAAAAIEKAGPNIEDFGEQDKLIITKKCETMIQEPQKKYSGMREKAQQTIEQHERELLAVIFQFLLEAVDQKTLFENIPCIPDVYNSIPKMNEIGETCDYVFSWSDFLVRHLHIFSLKNNYGAAYIYLNETATSQMTLSATIEGVNRGVVEKIVRKVMTDMITKPDQNEISLMNVIRDVRVKAIFPGKDPEQLHWSLWNTFEKIRSELGLLSDIRKDERRRAQLQKYKDITDSVIKIQQERGIDIVDKTPSASGHVTMEPSVLDQSLVLIQGVDESEIRETIRDVITDMSREKPDSVVHLSKAIRDRRITNLFENPNVKAIRDSLKPVFLSVRDEIASVSDNCETTSSKSPTTPNDTNDSVAEPSKPNTLKQTSMIEGIDACFIKKTMGDVMTDMRKQKKGFINIEKVLKDKRMEALFPGKPIKVLRDLLWSIFRDLLTELGLMDTEPIPKCPKPITHELSDDIKANPVKKTSSSKEISPSEDVTEAAQAEVQQLEKDLLLFIYTKLSECADQKAGVGSISIIPGVLDLLHKLSNVGKSCGYSFSWKDFLERHSHIFNLGIDYDGIMHIQLISQKDNQSGARCSVEGMTGKEETMTPANTTGMIESVESSQVQKCSLGTTATPNEIMTNDAQKLQRNSNDSVAELPKASNTKESSATILGIDVSVIKKALRDAIADLRKETQGRIYIQKVFKDQRIQELFPGKGKKVLKDALFDTFKKLLNEMGLMDIETKPKVPEPKVPKGQIRDQHVTKSNDNLPTSDNIEELQNTLLKYIVECPPDEMLVLNTVAEFPSVKRILQTLPGHSLKNLVLKMPMFLTRQHQDLILYGLVEGFSTEHQQATFQPPLSYLYEAVHSMIQSTNGGCVTLQELYSNPVIKGLKRVIEADSVEFTLENFILECSYLKLIHYSSDNSMDMGDGMVISLPTS
ncbi:unnamed protein product [Owenia fusiformis]|uniref:RNA helicase n=1 Tax=Owenia fusiformis TaxID=6347 RepID=A0A8S4Q6A0_OWEFU|nr:unnamed protein product [Owenia fusiformis]